MPHFKARVTVTLKQAVLDPQGQAIERALDALGFEGVQGVRQGKVFDVELDAADEAAARDQLSGMSEKLLVNGVIEDFAVQLT